MISRRADGWETSVLELNPHADLNGARIVNFESLTECSVLDNAINVVKVCTVEQVEEFTTDL